MKRDFCFLNLSTCLLAAALGLAGAKAGSAGSPAGAGEGAAIFNVRDFGASGRKPDFAGAAIQKAVDACAAAGGGMVYLPPGEYTSGTIHLRSHVRFHIEAGAAVFSAKDKAAFDKDALFYGEDLVNITLEGRGTVDGEADYEWRPRRFPRRFHLSEPGGDGKAGPAAPPLLSQTDQYGKLVLLLRCRDVRITGLSFIDSPSWTIHPYGCERLVIDGSISGRA